MCFVILLMTAEWYCIVLAWYILAFELVYAAETNNSYFDMVKSANSTKEFRVSSALPAPTSSS